MTYTVRMSEGETTLHWPPSAHPACVRRARLLPLHWLLLALTSVVAASPAQAQVRPAERTERFALSAHAALGLGGSMKLQAESLLGNTNATGFEEFSGLGLFGWRYSGALRPAPGLGVRLTFVGWRYLSLGVGVQANSLTYRNGGTSHITDIGLVLGGRYPLSIGTQGRLLTPYVALPVGLSGMRHDVRAAERFATLGYHVGAVLGLEVELVPGFGVYVESGFVHRRLEGEQRIRGTEEGLHHTVVTRQALVHLGLRAAR